MARIEFKEDKPGYANVYISPWKGDANVQITIQRNQDRNFFAQGSQWIAEPTWHKIPGLVVDANGVLKGSIGPWLIDILVGQVGNVQYLITIKDEQGNQDHGVLKMVGNILASAASGSSVRIEDVRVAPPAEPVVEDIPEEPVEIIIPPPIVEPAKSKSKLGLIIGLLLLFLLIGGLVYYLFFNNKSDILDIPNIPDTQVTNSDTDNACAIQNAGNDDLAFIRECLKTAPDSKMILEIIKQAQAAKKCGIAQRLYANKAQSGDLYIALAYAAEYDAGVKDKSVYSCFESNKDTAMYWYETALSINPDNPIAKSRLEELNK